MLARLLTFTFIVLALGLGPAQSGEPFAPSWVRNDPEAKSVTIDLIADFNEHPDVSDFNGYRGGSITLLVPTGWSVKVALSNRSGGHQHSLMVTRPYPPSQMPTTLTEADAVWGAYTKPLDGIRPGETAQLNFVAREAGSYYLACARQRHLASGEHWVGLEVKDGLKQAAAVIDEDKMLSQSAPGRP